MSATVDCPSCHDAMPRDAVWCGGCGALLERTTNRAGSSRRNVAVVGGLLLLVTAVVATSALLVQGRGSPTDPVASTGLAGRCDLDDEEPACATWVARSLPAPAIVVHDRLVVGRGGDAVGLDTIDGTETWSTAVEVPVDGFGASVAMEAAGLAVVNGELGGARALDPFSGEVVWSTDTGSILSSDDRAPLVLRSQTGFISGIEPSTGDVLWEFELDQRVYPEVLVAGDVVVARRDRGLQAIDRHSGAALWSTSGAVTELHGVAGDVVVVSGPAVARRAEGSITIHDLRTGTRLWTRAQAVGQQVAVAPDAVYLQADHTPLERLVPGNGALEWAVGGVRLTDVAVPDEVFERGVPVMDERWFQLLSPMTGDVVQQARVGRAGITQLSAGDNGDIVVTTPDGLHVLPADGPTRVELDAIAGHVVSAVPLVVQVGDRLLRVEDEATVDAPTCVVGLRRTRCSRWTVPEDGLDVAATDGVAVGVVAGALRGVSLRDGSHLWRHRLDDDPGLRPVASHRGTVVVAGRRVHGIAARDGSVTWTMSGSHVPLDGLRSDQVAVRRGRQIVLVDVRTGDQVEVLPERGATDELPPIVGLTVDSIVYASPPTERSSAGQVAIVDRATGEVRHVLRLPGAAVHVMDGSVFVGRSIGGVARVDPRSGLAIWEDDLSQLVRVETADRQGPVTVVRTLGDHAIDALDPATGEVLWSHEVLGLTSLHSTAGGIALETPAGVEVLGPDGATGWRLLRRGVRVVGVDPLMVVDDDRLVLVDDPTG